jgi:hypothetical protein
MPTEIRYAISYSDYSEPSNVHFQATFAAAIGAITSRNAVAT